MSDQAAEKRHTSCGHVSYMLTCSEYDALLAINSGHCHCCGKKTEDLVIDHDHDLGNWAVRGLICRSCNRVMGFIDLAERVRTTETDSYLAAPWHASQNTSTLKKRRTRPRIDCPVCNRNCAVRMKDGKPTYHWSRLPGKHNEMCPASY